MEMGNGAFLNGIRSGACEAARMHTFLDFRDVHEILRIDTRPLRGAPIWVKLSVEDGSFARPKTLQREHIEDTTLGIIAVRACTVPEQPVDRSMQEDEIGEDMPVEAGAIDIVER